MLQNIVNKMSTIIGIDVGGSTTKIIGIEHGRIKSPLFISAADPITSLFGAFGKYLYDNKIPLSEIQQVVLTGVGSAYIQTPLYGLPTAKVDEFIANAFGAKHESGIEEAIIVSMGTGTSFLHVNGEDISHIGGTGIGGGTLLGLARLLLHSDSISQVQALAEKGDLSHINLQIQDICNRALPGLPMDATASNFGKATHNATAEDIAAGLIAMVVQSIGSAAYLAGHKMGIKDYIVIGNLAKLSACQNILQSMGELYGIRFHLPTNAEFRTALGAALAYIEKRTCVEKL